MRRARMLLCFGLALHFVFVSAACATAQSKARSGWALATPEMRIARLGTLASSVNARSSVLWASFRSFVAPSCEYRLC